MFYFFPSSTFRCRKSFTLPLLLLSIIFQTVISCEVDSPLLRLKQFRASNTTEQFVISLNQTENEYVVTNYSEFITVLHCESREPVEWIYEGKGNPNLVREEYHVSNPGDNKTNASCHSSELFFRHEENYIKRLPFHTGKYSCRKIANQSSSQSVYLYFPRTDGQFLLSNPGKKLETIKHAVSALPGYLTFPCLSTTPSANISLFRKNEKEQALKKKIYEKLKNAVYDPKVGFTLEYSTLADVYGEYKCSSGQRKDYVIYNVVEDKAVKVYPNETLLFTSTVLNLTCEAEEPVVIHLVAFGQIQPDYQYYDDRDDIENQELEDVVESETTEHTELQSHVANYIDLHPAIGDVGEFQCLSEIDGEVLHSWVYQIISKEMDSPIVGIHYNESTRAFTCQTKTTARGKLSFILCDSPSECQINKKCLETFDNCRGYKKLPGMYCDWEKDCREIIYRSGTGYIRCVDDGVDEILGFADLPLGIHIANNLTSIRPEDAVSLTYDAEKVSVGKTLRVVLKKWNYIFTKQHRWAYRFENGTSVQLSKYDNLGSAKFEIYPGLKSVECLIMLRSEMTWFNASLLIPVENDSSKPTTLTIATDLPATITSTNGSLVENSTSSNDSVVNA